MSATLLGAAASGGTTTPAPGPEVLLELAQQGGVPPWILVVSLLPMALVLLTGFARISIILAFLRQGLGLQEVPSGTVSTGLAVLLSLVAMAPVLGPLQDEVVAPLSRGELEPSAALVATWGPLSGFMEAQTRSQDLEVFQLLLEERGVIAEPGSWQVLVPAFVLSELKSGFQIGLILWIPFLVVDLLAGVVLSLSGLSLEVRTVALPAKLLLFLVADGWTLLVTGVVNSFVGVAP